MRIVHLTASTFFGGPERQMLGLARHLSEEIETQFMSFSEGGRCREFLDVVSEQGFSAIALQHDTPDVFAALRELTELLRTRQIDLLLCHGYKANILGRIASRRVGIPAVAVSRGWTGENWKVRFYEWLDRRHMHRMDHVVCVSNGQAAKIRRCGVPESKLTVIRNSARSDAFAEVDPLARTRLRSHFSNYTPVTGIVVAAGRLSPEKGFDVLVQAVPHVLKQCPEAGFVLFGEGEERSKLEHLATIFGIGERFKMPGFSRTLDAEIPGADLLVLPSYTEGLPNVVLEASAAGVPVVATAVGGTPEAIVDGATGFLIPAGSPEKLAERIVELLKNRELRERFGAAGREFMREEFSFASQAAAYEQLFVLLGKTRSAEPVLP